MEQQEETKFCDQQEQERPKPLGQFRIYKMTSPDTIPSTDNHENASLLSPTTFP
jgi:hypothetical protein